MITDAGRVPLGRRAWLGDGRHGASLAPDGTVDWYSAGGVPAAPDLWRLLDDAGPALRVGPVRDDSGARRHLPPATLAYRPGTGVVDTILDGPSGRTVAVTDFVPWGGEGGLIRIARALSGPVDVEVEVLTGPDRRPGGGNRQVAPTGAGLLLDGLLIAAPGRMEAAPLDRATGRWRAVTSLDPGQEMVVTAGFDRPLGVDSARRRLQDTETAWRSWSARLAYAGPYRTEVERALLTIRSLTGPGGVPSAAGTTSLPRRVGSERGTDSRWVHLRTAAGAVRALAQCGLAEDAETAETWLRHTVATAHLPWPSWFDPDGQPVPDQEEQPLEGWRRSQPVLFGRRPVLDVGLLGAVTQVVGASMRGPGGRPGDPGPLSAAAGALAEAADWLADHWRHTDGGCWEIETPRRLYVAGRIEAWSALDRLARTARAVNPLDLQAAAWQQEARDVLSWLEATAIAPGGGLVMDATPGAPDEADAALLAVAWRGPWPAGHPVVTATVDRVIERLSSGGLLFRYSDRVSDERAGADQPDLEASLWAVRALAALGRWDEAHERLERVTGLVRAAGCGLLAETADPVSGEMYGNFPCVGAALALVDAALALEAGPR